MKQERIKTKRGFKGIGIFILGWFVGFVCTILILAGVGYWAYTSISVGKVEKWTKTDIAGDNEDIKSLTLQDVVGIAMGVAKGSNEYTLAKFEEDFGLKLLGDSLYGINLDKLKNAPIKELKTALDSTIDSANFNNVLSFMGVEDADLGLLKTVLDTKITYYINNNKLYTSDNYDIEVGFEYSIEGNVVKFSNGSHTVSSNKITARLRDLPLTTAMMSMQDATNSLKIYEVLGYEREGNENNYVYKDNGVEVTGIMKTLAGYSVSDLSNADTFNNIYIYEVMDYTREDSEGGYVYKLNGTEVTGIMSKIAGKTIGQLGQNDAFDDITVADALNYTIDNGVVKDKNKNIVTGVVKYLATSSLITLSTDIQALTVGKILDVEESEATGVIKALYNSNLSTLKTDIDNLTLGSALGVEQANATGVIKVLYNTKITELDNSMKDLKIYQAMGYYYNESDEKYYNTFDGVTYSNEVELSGIVKALANTKVDDLTTTIENLKATDVFDAETVAVLNLFTTEELNENYNNTGKPLSIMDLPNAVVGKINDKNTTIGTLLDAGVITTSTPVETDDPVRLLTISGLIEIVMQYT